MRAPNLTPPKSKESFRPWITSVGHKTLGARSMFLKRSVTKLAMDPTWRQTMDRVIAASAVNSKEGSGCPFDSPPPRACSREMGKC